MSIELERSLVVAGLITALFLLVIDFRARRQGQAQWPVNASGLGVFVGLLLTAIVVRWLRENQGPFLTLYDILLSNAFSLALIYLLAAQLLPSLRDAARVVLAFLALLTAWCMSAPVEAIPLPASFDNPWLWAHVLSGKLFLGLCLSAAATATVLFARRGATTGSAAENDDQDAAIWFLMSLAFVCHSFMLIAGAVWAHSAWGRYWAWDPLETWTLITWVLIVLTLHARVTFRRFPASLGWSAVILIFGLAMLTFLGVPFFSVAPHKGVM